MAPWPLEFDVSATNSDLHFPCNTTTTLLIISRYSFRTYRPLIPPFSKWSSTFIFDTTVPFFLLFDQFAIILHLIPYRHEQLRP
ncbi:hypothetical protein BDV18DRAFT_131145 [Aspergillus unguis]